MKKNRTIAALILLMVMVMSILSGCGKKEPEPEPTPEPEPEPVDTSIVFTDMAGREVKLEKPAEKIRIRPGFAQWQMDLNETDDPEQLMREYRADLETQAGMLLGCEGNRRFWADSCFICPENDRITDEMISRLAARYQEPSSGEEL